MTHHISIDVAEGYSVSSDGLHRAVLALLELLGTAPPVALTIRVTSSAEVQEMNRTYAGNDYPTDVLSFPAEEEPYEVDEGEPAYIGDIVIAYDVAVAQAAEAGIPSIIEMQTLSVHGTLHLLGYDHDTPESQAEMWALQSAAVDKVRTDFAS